MRNFVNTNDFAICTYKFRKKIRKSKHIFAKLNEFADERYAVYCAVCTYLWRDFSSTLLS